MHTVGAVAQLVHVSVRTLHHYDAIGLVQPSGRSAAHYRLYSQADVQRLQVVLFYRELGLPLEQIRALLNDPTFDRGAALREQRALLNVQIQRLESLGAAIDAALTSYEKGTPMSEESMFAVFGEDQRTLQAEAKERWGDSDAWVESRRRTAHYIEADWIALKLESEAILQRIADVYCSGASADSGEAMDAVEEQRLQIDRRFYACPPAMQVALAEMSIADPRFTATYEDLAPGLVVWVHDAMLVNAVRADATSDS